MKTHRSAALRLLVMSALLLTACQKDSREQLLAGHWRFVEGHNIVRYSDGHTTDSPFRSPGLYRDIQFKSNHTLLLEIFNRNSPTGYTEVEYTWKLDGNTVSITPPSTLQPILSPADWTLKQLDNQTLCFSTRTDTDSTQSTTTYTYTRL